MAKQKYILRYLPLFYDEFGEKLDYHYAYFFCHLKQDMIK